MQHFVAALSQNTIRSNIIKKNFEKDEIYVTLCCSSFPEYDTLAYYKMTENDYLFK
jgi:hypothetical protein